MVYSLIITDRADKLIDEHVSYLIDRLGNRQAAAHLIRGIEKIYSQLEENPYLFPNSRDRYLQTNGYKEALIPGMQYRLIFRIDDKLVYVVGLFHDLEDYVQKVKE